MKNDTEVINVINLSSKVISNDCLTVLNKGLSFSPTAHCNEFDIYIDLQKNFRNFPHGKNLYEDICAYMKPICSIYAHI